MIKSKNIEENLVELKQWREQAKILRESSKELVDTVNVLIESLGNEILRLRDENRRLASIVQEVFEQTGECCGVHNMD